MSLEKNKIYWLGVKLSDNTKIKHGSYRHPVYQSGVGLPVIIPPLLHTSIEKQAVFVFDETPIWIPVYLEGPYRHDDIFTI